VPKTNTLTVLEFAENTTITVQRIENIKKKLYKVPDGILIEHQLKQPTVLVLNTAGETVEVSTHYLSDTQLKIEWNGELTGTIYLLT